MSIKERWKGTKQIELNTAEAMDLILLSLKSDFRILSVYLFGSRISGKYNKASDIDMAIYTSENFFWDDYYILYGELTKRLHSDRLDLVWLNKAEPILSFGIIKEGRILFYRDADALNDFELRLKKRYYNYVLYLNKHRRYRKSDI